jgi:hypothetical protein
MGINILRFPDILILKIALISRFDDIKVVEGRGQGAALRLRSGDRSRDQGAGRKNFPNDN